MAILTNEDVARYAIGAGFNPKDHSNLYICVAIANAESGNNTTATNTSNSDGSTDRGLWQINSVHDGKLPGQDRYDPSVNAQLMMIISGGGTNWQPWTTYGNGAYNRTLPQVMAELGSKLDAVTPGQAPTGIVGAPSGPPGAPGAQPVGLPNPLDALSNVNAFFKLILSPSFWKRLLVGGMGISLIVIALANIMNVETGFLSTAKRAVVDSVPGGAAVSAATQKGSV